MKRFHVNIVIIIRQKWTTDWQEIQMCSAFSSFCIPSIKPSAADFLMPQIGHQLVPFSFSYGDSYSQSCAFVLTFPNYRGVLSYIP